MNSNDRDEIIVETREWFKAAVPKPEYGNVIVQIGCHLEEVVEMLDAMKINEPYTQLIHKNAIQSLAVLADIFKGKTTLQTEGEDTPDVVVDPIYDEPITQEERVVLLDALCDQIVTAVGVAHMLGMDIKGAMVEVNESNFSKFDPLLQPIFDENGKIMKGPNYRKPDLIPYI